VTFNRKQRVLLAVVPRLASVVITLLGLTWRYRDVQATAPDGTLVPIGITVPRPTIFAFWHCALLACALRFRNQDIAILISHSFDGELIARTVERLGFVAVRGSSSRGGATALRSMFEAYNEKRCCAFTADGPRGPARVAKPGPVALAQLTNAPWIGAFHAKPDAAWTLRSWDGFLIPKPFTTITFTWPAHVPPDLELLQHALDQAVVMAAGARFDRDAYDAWQH
jgi:lysophospholipid acyltransferase (LPLAT)-like uncharacterized protein